ncbi:helix-turn-helix domain-containing protein [Actinacidiphila acididurans]|nr:pyridoxamine 5'-phosphate oxidase family protein [Actinacidiphila acididurans]
MDDSPEGRGTPPGIGVLARRIAERCAELGLEHEELAREAGMSPRYLQHLLEAGPEFDPGGFLRIAGALGVPYQTLLHGPGQPPPGRAGAAGRPVLMRLSETECWDRIDGHGVGRVALPVRPGPAVFPVNYAVDAHTIVYRTEPGGPAAPTAGSAVSFQADSIDEEHSRGWSVLVTGVAETVEDPATIERLSAQDTVHPWAGGDRPLWIRIRPDSVSGRTITTM